MKSIKKQFIMSKKAILSTVFAIALVAVAGFGINKSMNSGTNLSNLALANVEALAFIEWGPDPEVGTFCDLSCYGGGYCWAIRLTWGLPCERTGYPYHYCKC